MSKDRIQTPTSPTLKAKLTELQSSFSESTEHLRAFRRTGSQYVYASPCSTRGLGSAWYVLLRLAPVYENSFGITQPLAVLYLTTEDVQPRHIEFLRHELIGKSDRPDKNLALLHAPDGRLEEKLDDWSTPSFSIVPIPKPIGPPDSYPARIVDAIRRRVFTRDLYYESTPVSGEKFFGRDALLKSVTADVLSGRSPALFGVRKSGKTSLLKQVERVITSRGQVDSVFIYRDLEHVPSPPEDPVPDIVRDLVADIREKSGDLRGTGNLDNVLNEPTVSTFRRAVDRIVQRNQGTLIVVALDEIEYLIPPDEALVTQEPIASIPQLLGALRSLAQENENFRFLLAGTTSWILEQGYLYGRPNPLLSWSKPYYMEPFVEEETAQLLRGIGHKVGAIWKDSGIHEVQGRTGGHAFLIRSLASAVLQSLPVQVEPRTVQRQHVALVLPEWRREQRGLVKEWVDQINRYYPIESLLLEALLEDRRLFGELAEENEVATNRLLKLGLAKTGGEGEFMPSDALEAGTFGEGSG